MINTGTQEIKTKRLLLRRFTPADAEAMFSAWANDPDVTRFLSWEPHGSVEVTKALLDKWTADYESDDCYNWLIEFGGSPVGTISLLNPDSEACEAEAGYCLAKSCWGKGVMTEALTAVIKYAFSQVGFRRITAKHDVNNPASGRVMEKSGMTYITTKLAPLALKPDEMKLCRCYEIINTNT